MRRLPPPAAPAPAPAPPADTCTTLRYYTMGNSGWSWLPSSVCLTAGAINIDEQRIALQRLTAHCRVKPLFPTDDAEWWLSDGTETHKFRGSARDLDTVETALVRAVSSVPHGSCADRAVQHLLAGAGR